MKNIESAQQEFEASIITIADSFRTTVMAPFCKKHNLKFVSGNGRFFFVDEEGNDYTGEDYNDLKLNKKIAKEAKPIFVALNIDITYNQSFGFYVSDIK